MIDKFLSIYKKDYVGIEDEGTQKILIDGICK